MDVLTIGPWQVLLQPGLTGHEWFVPHGDTVYVVAVRRAASRNQSTEVDAFAKTVAKSFVLLN